MRPVSVARAVPAAVLLASVAACGDAGDLSVVNESTAEVVVSTQDETFDVSSDGGTVLLDYGCTPGDVSVKYPDGRTVVLEGPICPDEEIVVRDDDVEVRPSGDAAA